MDGVWVLVRCGLEVCGAWLPKPYEGLDADSALSSMKADTLNRYNPKPYNPITLNSYPYKP